MRTKSDRLMTAATARPVRVAYLIDTNDCPHELLDSIFSQSYGRRGGRRTLIVPATPNGIDPRFTEWFWFYDADIIYSFVSLTDQAVAAIHGRYGPAHLVHHNPIGATREDDRFFRIE